MQRRVAIFSLALAAALVPLAVRAGIGDTPYVGEVRILGFNFCPAGWAAANGQLLPIAEYDVLFNLYGTTFGGDGQESFGMPDLRGRVPIAAGTGPGLTTYGLGESGGTEELTLSAEQMPLHTHVAGASSQTANAVLPTATLRGQKVRTKFHRSGGAANTAMAADAIAPAGGSQPIPNVPPFTTFSVCVSLFGVYPSQP